MLDIKPFLKNYAHTYYKGAFLGMILAIETSTTIGSIAILRDERIVYQDFADLKTTHSETIMVRIDNALKSLKYAKSDLKAVCISNGPGSFTGLRIGLATAKGICTGLKIPLVAFNTLEVLAANVYGTDRNILSILPAHKNEAYIAVFDPFLNVLIETHNRENDKVLENLSGKFICVGDIQHIASSANPPLASGVGERCVNYDFALALPHQNMLVAAAQFSLLKHKNISLVYDQDYIYKLEPCYYK